MNRLNDKRKYYKLVWNVTKQQPIELLENCDKRGLAAVTDAYHSDHKISISHGFLNNTSPKKICDISNLRFIPWLENIVKQGENYYG